MPEIIGITNKAANPGSIEPAQSAPVAPGFLGLLNRRERWGLSWPGRFVLLGLVLLGGWAFMVYTYPFLAETDRVDANILVVEGWVHQFGAVAALKEFDSGAYPRAYTTGGPMEGTGAYTSDGNTVASLGASMLQNVRFPADAIQMVPSHVSGRDRTYSSALALRQWLQEKKIVVRGINIVTEGAHARRTRLLFQEAFGNDVPVGVISAVNPDYDAKHWWRYSEGVREVIGENLAYIYARFFFHPPSQAKSE